MSWATFSSCITSPIPAWLSASSSMPNTASSSLRSFGFSPCLGIGYYLYLLIRRGAPTLLLVCIAMILGGAIGNLIDSIFYGVWLNNAPADAPWAWFYGQVIDMFYIDIWEGRLPDWIPFMGGRYLSLWPVFNIADASIFVSVIVILIFQKRFFKKAIHTPSEPSPPSMKN